LIHLAKLSLFALSVQAFESVDSISKAVALTAQCESRLLPATNCEGRCGSSVCIADAVRDVRDRTYSTIVIIVDRIRHSRSCSERQNTSEYRVKSGKRDCVTFIVDIFGSPLAFVIFVTSIHGSMS
jgi:hypothetical protein